MMDVREGELRNLRQEVERLRSRLWDLADLGTRITSSLDLPVVLQSVVDAARDLTGARFGALGVFDADSRMERFITSGITQEERERIGDLPQGLGILGLLHRQQSAVRLGDLSKHPRSVGFPPDHPPMKAFLGAPIRHGDTLLGNLYLTEKESAEEFTPEDEQVLVLFAVQAALAVNNAHQYFELRESETLFQALAEVSPTGIFRTDREGRCVYVNERWCEIAGLTAQEAAGEGWSAGLHPEDRDAIFDEWRRAAVESVPFEMESRFQRPDGATTWVFGQARAETDDRGAVTGYVGTITDITERKNAEAARAQSEQALRRSERQLRDVLDNTTTVIYIKDTEGRYIDVNRRYEELFHVTNDAVKDKTDYDLFPKETADVLWANDRKVLKTGTPLELDEVVPQDDGPHTYISLKFLLLDEEEKPYAVCGISTDITDRRNAEEALRTERERLETLLRTSPVGVLVIEADSEKVLLINREAERILGVSYQPDHRLERYERSATREARTAASSHRMIFRFVGP